MPNSGCVEFVDQDSINDSLPYFVVVPGLRFDIIWGRTERFAATTLGSIFAVENLPPQFLLKCYRTNASDSNPFKPPEVPALRTRSLSRMTRFSYRFGGCFLASMLSLFFCVFRKPNKGNQAFLCLHRSPIWWRLARSVFLSEKSFPFAYAAASYLKTPRYISWLSISSGFRFEKQFSKISNSIWLFLHSSQIVDSPPR